MFLFIKIGAAGREAWVEAPPALMNTTPLLILYNLI